MRPLPAGPAVKPRAGGTGDNDKRMRDNDILKRTDLFYHTDIAG